MRKKQSERWLKPLRSLCLLPTPNRPSPLSPLLAADVLSPFLCVSPCTLVSLRRAARAEELSVQVDIAATAAERALNEALAMDQDAP